MTTKQEREILIQFLELYRNLPCLWDLECDKYKDKNEKTQAWKLMVLKLKLIQPDANVAAAKRRIENMRTAYYREEKKIKISKRRGEGDVHLPKLWYFPYLKFLEGKKRDQVKSRMDPLMSDDESPSREQYVIQPSSRSKRKKIAKKKVYEIKKQELIENKPVGNAFGVYVGEQLQKVSTLQRCIAEKLISEVIFLAKMERLNCDSTVVARTRRNTVETNFSTSSMHSSPSQSPQSHDIYQFSPQYIHQSPSPQITQRSPSPYIIQSASASSQVIAMSIPSSIRSSSVVDDTKSIGQKSDTTCEASNSLLKELLITKNAVATRRSSQDSSAPTKSHDP